MVATPNPPTFVDLFAGVGGFSLGCIQAGMRQLYAFDNDSLMVEAYRGNITRVQSDARAECLDLASVSESRLLELLGGERPDIVVGGPPCQGFSVRGLRKLDDHRSRLIFSFIDWIGVLQPEAFVLENVYGIFSMGDVTNQLRQAAIAAGYSNATWVRIDASDFGVPQRRSRALLLGSKAGRIPKAPAIAADSPQATVADALAGLPRARLKHRLPPDGRLPYREGAQWSRYAEQLRNSAGTVSGCQQTVHESDVAKRLKVLAQGSHDSLTGYRRLRDRGVSYTLRAGSRRRTAQRPIHPHANRVITVREAARLHSFPDWYEFHQFVSIAHVQVGNSVPPLMAKAIAKTLISLARTAKSQAAAA